MWSRNRFITHDSMNRCAAVAAAQRRRSTGRLLHRRLQPSRSRYGGRFLRTFTVVTGAIKLTLSAIRN
jgi:hypothetical protein